MQVLLTYQLSEATTTDKRGMMRLKEMLKAAGYQDSISGINGKGEKISSVLPNTTLYKERTNAKDARADLRAAAKVCGLVIECCIAVEIMEWSAITRKN